MICYKDKTFCPYHENCIDAKTCDRPLTDEVKEAARKWWNRKDKDAPICVFAEIPPCHKEIK